MSNPFRLTLLAAVLAACGGGSSSSSGPGPLTGTIRGQPFTPVEVSFAGPESAACTSPIAFGNNAILLGFSAQPGVCALASTPCTGRKDFTFVAGLVAHAKLFSQAPTLGPGTYTVYTDYTSATPDLNGELHAAAFAAEHTDASTCQLDSSPPLATGTITLATVSAAQVTGSIDLQFADRTGAPAGSLKGPFTATSCQASFDACSPSLSACTGTFTCQ